MTRQLRTLPCPTGPAVLDVWWEALAAALDGSGPGLIPVPDGAPGAAVSSMAQPSLPLERDDIALVVPTSGSTGAPKGALLPSAALRHSATATLERLGGPGRWLLALPVTHIAGQQVLVRSLLVGRPPVVLDLGGGFDPTVFVAATRRLDGSARRYTALVPTQLARLLTAGDAALEALRSFDAVLLGGAAAPPALLHRARRTGVRLVTTYGMSETCGGCVYDGLPLRGVRTRIGDDGRILLGGDVLFAGYRLRPDLTAEALVTEVGELWHVTRDLGRVVGDRLQVDGRMDDLIITGGEKVPPLTVEALLTDFPDIREAVVVGVPDPEWGQRVRAVVVPESPGRPPTLDQLRDRLRDRLANYALPTELRLVAALPLLESGKPDRAAMRGDAAEGSAPQRTLGMERAQSPSSSVVPP
jgi:O-succinylbenzoic acid--CoA ligase